MVSIMFLTIKYAKNAKFFMRVRLEAVLQILDFMKFACILKIFLNVISDQNISLLGNLNRNNWLNGFRFCRLLPSEFPY